MMDTLKNASRYLDSTSLGILASEKYKNKLISFEEILEKSASSPIKFRKKTIEYMHMLIWYHELQKILLSKCELGKKEFKLIEYSAGNIFISRRIVIEKAHRCLYNDFFNLNSYREDGEVEHGLERFYFYVSKCMGYENIFI